jgi:hypothetical protein
MIWHILKKDLNRLAVPIGIALVLLGALTTLDARRFDYYASWTETLLNLILPLAWAVLIALAVHLEPLTLDTAFWVTRPYRRSTLFAAKLLFAIVTIHLPLLVSHGIILSAHGFMPFAPELFWKQAAVFFAVTIPALALASLNSTLTGFGWSALGAMTGALLLLLTPTAARYPSRVDWMAIFCSVLVLAAGGTTILALQYSKRTVRPGRVLGGLVAIAGSLLYFYLPGDTVAEWECAIQPDPPSMMQVTLQADRPVKIPQYRMHPTMAVLAFPLRVTGLEPATLVTGDAYRVRLSASGGRAWQVARPRNVDYRTWWSEEDGGRGFVHTLTPDRAFVSDVGRSPARLEAQASVRPYRRGEGFACVVQPNRNP